MRRPRFTPVSRQNLRSLPSNYYPGDEVGFLYHAPRYAHLTSEFEDIPVRFLQGKDQIASVAKIIWFISSSGCIYCSNGGCNHCEWLDVEHLRVQNLTRSSQGWNRHSRPHRHESFRRYIHLAPKAGKDDRRERYEQKSLHSVAIWTWWSYREKGTRWKTQSLDTSPFAG